MQRPQISSFDYTVIAVLTLCLALLLVVVWRGDQVGAQENADNVAGLALSPTPSPPTTDFYYLLVDEQGVAQIDHATLGEVGAPVAAPQRMTSTPQGVWDYTVSPRDGALLFSQLRDGGTADLWRVAPGGEPALLLDCEDAACNTPAYSADGALLAYSRHNATTSGAALMNPPRIWLLDVASGENAPLFSDNQRLGYDPLFSPDGAWLAFVSPEESNTTLVRLQDGFERSYAAGMGEVGAWHPQSEFFMLTQVLTDSESFPTHLMLVDMQDGSKVDVSAASLPPDSPEVNDDSPAFSPDGEWVAFRRKFLAGAQETPGKQIWVMRLDGSEARALTDDAAFDNAAPQWSHDGETLLFHRYNLRNAPIISRIMATSVDDGILWEAISPGQNPRWRD